MRNIPHQYSNICVCVNIKGLFTTSQINVCTLAGFPYSLFFMCKYCMCECFRVFLGLLLGVCSKCFCAAAVSALAMSQWLVLATVEMPPNGAYACIPTHNTLLNSLHIL